MRKPKIEDSHFTFGSHQDIERLYVPVNDTECVESGISVQNAAPEIE